MDARAVSPAAIIRSCLRSAAEHPRTHVRLMALESGTGPSPRSLTTKSAKHVAGCGFRSTKCSSTIRGRVRAWLLVTAKTTVLTVVGTRLTPSLPVNPFSRQSQNPLPAQKHRARMSVSSPSHHPLGTHFFHGLPAVAVLPEPDNVGRGGDPGVHHHQGVGRRDAGGGQPAHGQAEVSGQENRAAHGASPATSWSGSGSVRRDARARGPVARPRAPGAA